MTASRARRRVAFRAGHALAPTWRAGMDAVLDQIGVLPPGANLGFLYLSDRLAGDCPVLLAALRDRTGVRDWVGTVGIGVLGTGTEFLDEPALSAMVGALPPGEFSVFSGRARAPEPGTRTASGAEAAHFAIVHGDPNTPDMPDLIEDMSSKLASGYLVGGLSSSRERTFQFANGVLEGGLSGIVLSSAVEVTTRLTQGCSPLGGRRVVTAGGRNVIAALDDRPALDVLREDLGDSLGGDLRRAAAFVHVGLPVARSDTGDFLVRNLVGIDPQNKLIAIGAEVEPGMPVMFCKRDAATAREDLGRMLEAIAADLDGPPRGGLYFSCLGRGEHLFGRRSAELGIVRDRLGDFPLAGFFCNGEISHDRLYGYTGVLALFK
jgi:small ligand-binding sensory domain FIST